LNGHALSNIRNAITSRLCVIRAWLKRIR